MEHQQQVAIVTYVRANAKTSVVVVEEEYTTGLESVSVSFAVIVLIQENRNL